jgi:predicted dehydrogenase
MKHIRIGIVGTGGMGGTHARRFKAVPGIQLLSCYDIDTERARRFATEHGFQFAAGDLDELIAAVDAVSVVTSDAGHAPVSLAVLAAGKHLFCEKPLTVTLAEARQVAKAYRQARRQGVVGMVNFSHRGAHFVKAQQMIARGDLGELRYVRAHYLQGWLCDPHATGNPSRIWRLQRRPGADGVLGDLGCHLIDFVTGICGKAKWLRCEFRTHPKLGRSRLTLDANDTAAIQFDFDGGAFGEATTTRWASGRRNEVLLEIYGTNGAMSLGHARPDKPFLRLCRGRSLKTWDWKEVPVPPMLWTWQRFVRAVRSGKPHQPDILRGAEVQSYLDACIRSARSGRWVSALAP